jgi:hypothetical protein
MAFEMVLLHNHYSRIWLHRQADEVYLTVQGMYHIEKQLRELL